MKGVITADVVGSTQIKTEERGELPKLIRELVSEIDDHYPELQLRVEVSRGDSFQVWVERLKKLRLWSCYFVRASESLHFGPESNSWMCGCRLG